MKQELDTSLDVLVKERKEALLQEFINGVAQQKERARKVAAALAKSITKTNVNGIPFCISLNSAVVTYCDFRLLSLLNPTAAAILTVLNGTQTMNVFETELVEEYQSMERQLLDGFPGRHNCTSYVGNIENEAYHKALLSARKTLMRLVRNLKIAEVI